MKWPLLASWLLCWHPGILSKSPNKKKKGSIFSSSCAREGFAYGMKTAIFNSQRKKKTWGTLFLGFFLLFLHKKCVFYSTAARLLKTDSAPLSILQLFQFFPILVHLQVAGERNILGITKVKNKNTFCFFFLSSWAHFLTSNKKTWKWLIMV